MARDEFQANKLYSEIKKRSLADCKPNYCLLCGKTNCFCNSHSIPEFILRNISTNGKVYYSNQLTEIPLIPTEFGLSRAGAFKLICAGCDKSTFSDYEDPNIISGEPNNLVLTEIAMKNLLYQIFKRRYDIAFLNHTAEIQRNAGIDYDKQKGISKIDLESYQWSFKRAKKIYDNKLKSGYHLVFWHKCNYVVPIAFQCSIVLYGDLNGKIINDIYDISKSRMQEIHVVIFPLREESVIFLFTHKDDRNYLAFKKQLLCRSPEDRLKIINFIVFQYSEDVFLSQKIKDDALANQKLLELSKENLNFFTPYKQLFELRQQKYLNCLKNIPEIPNLLSREYAISE